MNNKIKYFLKRISIVFVFAISSLCTYAQIYQYQENGWLGLKDYTSNTIITPAIYDDIKQCQTISYPGKDIYEDDNNGKPIKNAAPFWIVQKNDLYGVINKSGAVIIPIEWTQIDADFKYGYISFQKLGKKCLADTTGRIIIENQDGGFIQRSKYVYVNADAKYDSSTIVQYQTGQVYKVAGAIRGLNEDAQLFISEKNGSVYDFEGKCIVSKSGYTKKFQFQQTYISAGNKSIQTLFDVYGNIVFQDSCQKIQVIQNNFLLIEYKDKEKKWYALKDTTGKKILNAIITYEPDFFKHFFTFYTYKENIKTLHIYSYDGIPAFNKIGINYIEPYGNGYLLSDGKTYYLADSTGAVLNKFPLNQIYKFRDTPYLITYNDEHSYVVNAATGEIVLQQTTTNYSYNNIITTKDAAGSMQFFICIRKDSLSGLINSDGKEIIPLKYKRIFSDENRLIAWAQNNSHTYFSTNGEILFENVSSLEKRALIPGLIYIASSSQDTTWGYAIYDKTFKEIFRTKEHPMIHRGYCMAIKPANSTKYGLWGINGEEFVKPEYDNITILNMRCFIVKQNGLCGIINSGGKILIPFEYDAISYSGAYSSVPLVRCMKNKRTTLYKKTTDDLFVRLVNGFYEEIYTKITEPDYFIVKENGKWGLISTTAIIIPIVYDKLEISYDNLIILRKNNEVRFSCYVRPGIITEPYAGFQYSTEEYYTRMNFKKSAQDYRRRTDKNADVIIRNSDKKYGILNKECKLILAPLYDQVLYQGNNTYVIYQNKKAGIFYNGAFISPIDADSVIYAKENNQNYFYLYRNQKYYTVSVNTKQQLSEPFQKIFMYPGNYLIVSENNKWGVLNPTENTFTLDTIYQQIYSSGQTGELIIKQNSLYGLASEQGKILIPAFYDSVESIYSSNYYRVKKGGMYGVCDNAGKQILPCTYASIETTGEYFKAEWLKQQRSYGSSSKKIVFSKEATKYVELKKNLFLVKKQGLFGVIDTNQQEIISIQYDSIGEYDAGYELTKAAKYGYADYTGRVIVPVAYDEIDKVEETDAFYFSLNKKWGVMSLDSKVLIKPLYDDMEYIPEASVYILDKGDSSGIANALGEIILPIKYDDIDAYKAFCFVGNANNKYAVFSFTGKKFITGFIYDDYEEKRYGEATYYILIKETDDDDKLGLYIPDDADSPIKPQYERIEYNYDNDNFELFYPSTGGKQMYQIYSKRHALSKPMNR